MKNPIYFLALILLTSCKPKPDPGGAATHAEIVDGKALFENKGNCIACHQPEQKVIGPGLKEIAAAYKLQKGGIVKFLRGKADPIVDPAQFETMRTNLAVTKNMSSAELKALEDYIYGFGNRQ